MNGKSNVSQILLVHKHELLYTQNHTWAKIVNDRTVKVGLSKYAYQCLTELRGSRFLLFHIYDLVPAGIEVKRMQPFGLVDTKFEITFELSSPLSGVIKKVNLKALDDPYFLTGNPEDIWLVKIEPTCLEEEAQLLLIPDQYKKFCERCDGISASNNIHINEHVSEWHPDSSNF